MFAGGGCVFGEVCDDLYRFAQPCGDFVESLFADASGFGMDDRTDGRVDLYLIRVDTADLFGDVVDGDVVGIDAFTEKDLQPKLTGVFGAEAEEAIDKSFKDNISRSLFNFLEGFRIPGIERRQYDIRLAAVPPDTPVGQQGAVGNHGDGDISQFTDAVDQFAKL